MKITEEIFNEILQDYKHNIPCKTIGLKYNIDPSSLLKFLKKKGVTIRPKIKQKERKLKSYEKYNINPNIFLKDYTPESVYILGLIWADGYTHIKRGSCPITITTTNPDAYDIEKIVLKTGNWKIYKYKDEKYPSWKERVTITTNNYPLANFLMENDYHAKSFASADKIISKIPDNLTHYWFRGLFDGDGWLYHKGRTIQSGIASSYEQDWQFLELLCNRLNIKFSIKRTISKKQHKSSTFRILGKQNCINFFNYIYKGANKEQIYLNRKYQKYLNLIEYIKQMNEFHAKRHINALSRNPETASNTKQIKL